MSNGRKRDALPQKCYALLPYEDRLAIIIQGKPGYMRSPLDRGDKHQNRVIADEKNTEFGGVTPEQEKAMIKGAIFDWEFDGVMADGLEHPGKIMELEISRPGSFGTETSTTLALPATPYEILDALDKARVTDERVIYSSEILSCELDYLPQFISPSVNLHELNHLAQRLSGLSEWELDCFEGMMMMDMISTQYAPIAIDRLINMTHSTADCQIAYEAHDDASLGLFYADNGFIPTLETLPEYVFKWLDYSKMGKEMRKDEGGVFTSSGYVLQNGEIAHEYMNGDAIPRQKSDYAMLLQITKGYFNDPEYDNDLTAMLRLPAKDQDLFRAMKEVDAAVREECKFVAVDCMIPRIAEMIADNFEASGGTSYGMVNELAAQLQRLDRENKIPTYKAMIEAAPKGISLDDALDLAYQTDSFSLLREAASPEDYAAKEIQRILPYESSEGLERFFNLHNYGRFLMERKTGFLRQPTGYLYPATARR